MQLDRRSFLRLSALGSAALVVPLGGAGCAGPSAVAVRPGSAGELLYFDAEGRLLELQPASHRVLVHPVSGGAPTVLGGFGTGPAQLNGPSSLAVGPDGRVYVADRGNGRVQVYDLDGRYHSSIGGPDVLSYPYGVCVDANNQLWVSDPGQHRLQRFSTDGAWLGSCGEDDLNGPLGLALGPDGRVHAVEVGRGSVAIFSPSGAFVGRYGGRELGLMSPRAIAIDSQGTSFVTDATAGALFVFDADGSLRERLSLTRDGAPASPVHVAVGPDGAVEVATLPGAPV